MDSSVEFKLLVTFIIFFTKLVFIFSEAKLLNFEMESCFSSDLSLTSNFINSLIIESVGLIKNALNYKKNTSTFFAPATPEEILNHL